MSKAREILLSVLAPLVLAVVFVLSWHCLVKAFDTPSYLVPTPGEVVLLVGKNLTKFAGATWVTAKAALFGFSASLVAGTLIASAFSQSRLIRLSGYPYAIFFQTVPIVAIAPLIITWFGNGFQSVVIVAFIISLFPIITNGTSGMLAVDPDLLDLFRLHKASRWPRLVQAEAAGFRPAPDDRSSHVQRSGRHRSDRRRISGWLRHGRVRARLSDSNELQPAEDGSVVCRGDLIDATGADDFRRNESAELDRPRSVVRPRVRWIGTPDARLESRYKLRELAARRKPSGPSASPATAGRLAPLRYEPDPNPKRERGRPWNSRRLPRSRFLMLRVFSWSYAEGVSDQSLGSAAQPRHPREKAGTTKLACGLSSPGPPV